MKKLYRCSLAAAATVLAAGSVALLASGVPASAATCTATSNECTANLNIISASNIGSGTQGTITLTELNADEVVVGVSLVSGVEIINTGSHTPFLFNLSSALMGVTVAISTTKPYVSSSTPATFSVLSGPQSDPGYGTFTNGIGYNGPNGGGHGNAGPLFFTITDTNGINLTDFVTSAGGANCAPCLFAADVIGTGGQTGAVAANALVDASTPLPATLPLFAGGLGFLGFLSKRRKSAKQSPAVT